MVAWLHDEVAVRTFLQQKSKSILDRLDASGFVCIPDFLPTEAAEAVQKAVQNLQNWELADGKDDEGYSDATPHRFALAELDGSRDEPEDDSEGEGEGPSQSQYIELDGGKKSKKSGAKPDTKPPGKFLRRDRVTLRLFGKLMWNLYRTHTHSDGTTEETLPNFTAACYRHRDHIAPHSDDVLETYERAEVEGMKRYFNRDNGTEEGKAGSAKPASALGAEEENEDDSDTDEDEDDEVGPSDLSQVNYSRKLALVYYLNKGWKAEYGGELQDIETGAKILPEFNSLVLFRIPRMHQVLPVRKKSVKRFSIFGWWLCETQEDSLIGAAEVSEASGQRCTEISSTNDQEDTVVAARDRDVSGKRSAKRSTNAEKQDDVSASAGQLPNASADNRVKRRKKAQ